MLKNTQKTIKKIPIYLLHDYIGQDIFVGNNDGWLFGTLVNYFEKSVKCGSEISFDVLAKDGTLIEAGKQYTFDVESAILICVK